MVWLVQLSLGVRRQSLWMNPVFRPQEALALALGSLFHGLDVTFLQPTSLTLLYPLASPSNSTDISLEPMEISTFRLRLG